MLNFIFARWKAIKIKYKKFIPFIFTLIFCFNPLSAFATNLPLSSVPYSNTSWPDMRFRVNSSGSWSSYYRADYISNEYYTNFTDTSVFSGVSRFLYGFDNDTAGFEYPFNFESFDYYLAFNFMSYGSNYTQAIYDVSGLRFDGYNENNNVVTFDLPTVNISSFSQNFGRGFSILSKIPDNISINLSNQIVVICSSSTVLCLPANVSAFVYQVPKYTSEDSVSAIVNAINNQTDYIVNGNDSTGGIVSQFQSNLNEFNSVINQFDDIENGFISDFTSSNDEIKSTLSDYQFTGNLLTCANWVTNKYMDFFDNSGDFKQYFIYPLIIGIVLFFIGRGQVILGQAYRKPYESTTVTSSDSSGYTRNKDGSWSPTGYKGSTTTTTYRSGGKLRK